MILTAKVASRNRNGTCTDLNQNVSIRLRDTVGFSDCAYMISSVDSGGRDDALRVTFHNHERRRFKSCPGVRL